MNRRVLTQIETARAIVSRLQFHGSLRILDMGCGEGVFLQAVGESLLEHYSLKITRTTANILAKCLVGIDIEGACVNSTKERLKLQFGQPTSMDWNVFQGDALELPDGPAYNIILGNPPFIRIHDIESSIRSNIRNRFNSATGPFDIYQLFIEKAIGLLRPGGQLAMIVPNGFTVRPSTNCLRHMLSETGNWSTEEISSGCFEENVGVKAELLLYRKYGRGRQRDKQEEDSTLTLGDIAKVTTGIVTGADDIFVISKEQAINLNIEPSRLRPVLKGRHIGSNARMNMASTSRLVWPYQEQDGKLRLVQLSDYPGMAKYLSSQREKLMSRKRMSSNIKRYPESWFAYVDQKSSTTHAVWRIVLPDVFIEPRISVLYDPNVMVLNSCFQILPHADETRAWLFTLLSSTEFKQALVKRSRVLRGEYRRTSVTELRSLPIDF